MNRLNTLLFIVLVVLFPIAIKSSIVKLKSIKTIESIESNFNPKTIEVKNAPIGETVTIMAWVNKDKTIGFHQFTESEFNNLSELANSISSKELEDFLKLGKSISTREFVTLIENPERRIIEIASLIH